jgi:hypothetical protein
MIECVFTFDYEIYGNGRGSLRDLVYEPAERLRAVFRKWDVPLVLFVEAAEMEIIGSRGADPAIGLVERQIREFHAAGSEIGLHLHPQWYNARHEGDRWQLDLEEYNLCLLSADRIDRIVERAIAYLRRVLGESEYTPSSFRAGNWLLQPTGAVSRPLAAHGLKVDSSVFKGGRQNRYRLDYRRSLRNGYFWSFSQDVNVPDSGGVLLEIPTFSRMVPLWRMFTSKRIGLQNKAPADPARTEGGISRLKDYARLSYPMKLDFCRLSVTEMTGMLERERRLDRDDPGVYRPIVAIGHTKDLLDVETIDAFLSYLQRNSIPVTTLRESYEKIMGPAGRSGGPSLPAGAGMPTRPE